MAKRAEDRAFVEGDTARCDGCCNEVKTVTFIDKDDRAYCNEAVPAKEEDRYRQR